MTIKRYPKVHLNFPVERKYADHNEGKKMLITICLFYKKKMCQYKKCSILKFPAPCGGGGLKLPSCGLLVFLLLILYIYTVQSKGF